MTRTGSPLLTTRLAIPRPSHTLVARPELVRRLDSGLGRQLILVSAPPGFGKTTLLADWLQSLERRAQSAEQALLEASAEAVSKRSNDQSLKLAWLSIEERDNDPAHFLTYLIAALQTVAPMLGATTLALMQSPQLLPDETLLVPLINDLAGIQMQIVLTLDDYHLIESDAVHRIVSTLLDHQLPQLTLIIASRTVPPLPLARLRGRGQLVDLRPADLRLSREQAAAFLHQVMGLDLAPADVAALDTRTEGWVAGLQLAALSMRGRDDIQGFLAAFTGSHRYLFDYLSDEVLRRQPPQVQSFLLQTSILERLCASLCDAVIDSLNSVSSQLMLEQLERLNLFLVPLDDEGRWYRYHQLFADMLRARLQQTQPDRALDLHRRASAWHLAQGNLAEAIGHALAAGDAAWAGELVEQVAPTLLVRSEVTTLLRWLRLLPAALIDARPGLGLAYAWALTATGQLDAVESRLLAVERTPGLADDLLGEVLAVRATVAGLRRDQPEATVALAQQALNRLSEAKSYVRGVVTLMLGAAHYQRGDLVAAIQAFSESEAISRATGNLISALFALRQLAEIEVMRGHLHQAAAIYRRSLALAAAQYAEKPAPSSPLPVAGTAYIGLGELQLEWNNLAAAVESLRTGVALGEQATNVEILLRGYIRLAQALDAQGDSVGARVIFERALDTALATGVPRLLGWVRQAQALLLLRQGDAAAAQRWVRESGLSPDDELQLFGEEDYIALARILLVKGRDERDLEAAQAAARLLDRLLRTAEANGRTGTAAEVLALQALAHDTLGDGAAAQVALDRALSLAAPEGYVRLFVNEGEPLKRLIVEARKRLGAVPPQTALRGYVERLLAAFAADSDTADTDVSPKSSSNAHMLKGLEEARTLEHSHALVEPLSERELEVLGLVAAGLSNQAIADRLVVAISTVKKHINSIYGKLDVHSRTQALLRARKLGLLN